MVVVNAATTEAGQKREAYAELAAAKAAAAIAQIETDLATLNGSPTNADVVAIIKRELQREKKEIKVLLYIIQDITGG